MNKLLNPDDSRYQLGVSQMDATHLEFIDLVNQLDIIDKSGFKPLFAQLLEHTEQHFESEKQLMQQTHFPASQEHQGEHLRILGDLQRMTRTLQNGSLLMARAYVREMLPGWFNLHAITMDSALAAHIKSCATQADQENPVSISNP